MAKGSVRKKGKKWYGRFYIEDESGKKVSLCKYFYFTAVFGKSMVPGLFKLPEKLVKNRGTLPNFTRFRRRLCCHRCRLLRGP